MEGLKTVIDWSREFYALNRSRTHFCWLKETKQEKHQRTYISEMAQKGAAIKPLGKMCKTCAFKLNSDANLEAHNVQTAFECVAFEQNTFNCHEEINKDKGCPCVGYLHAKQYCDSKK